MDVSVQNFAKIHTMRHISAKGSFFHPVAMFFPAVFPVITYFFPILWKNAY